MITVDIKTENSELKSVSPTFNINKASWHLITSNEIWKQVANPSHKSITLCWSSNWRFLQKNPSLLKICISVIEIKKKFLSPVGVVNYKSLETKENDSTKYSRNPRASNTSSSGKRKIRAEIKILALKNSKEDWGNLQLSQLQYTYESSLAHSKAVERQKSKKSKHAWSRWSTVKRQQNIANKIGDTLAELSFP